MTEGSVEKVVTRDLITEILRRIPVRSLIQLKLVSKHWYSMIRRLSLKNQLNLNLEPPCGVFLPVNTSNPTEFAFFAFEPHYPLPQKPPPFVTLGFYPEANSIYIVDSTNCGLMICQSRSDTEEGRVMRYHIYNPTINEYITLPLPVPGHSYLPEIDGLSLAFDPARSPHYNIVRICRTSSDIPKNESRYLTQIYSSETEAWRDSVSFCVEFHSCSYHFMAGVYWNDAIHWPRPYDQRVAYFKLKEEQFDHIPYPPEICTGNAHHETLLFESRGSLFLIETYMNRTFELRLNIFELTRNYTGWSLKHSVNLGCTLKHDGVVDRLGDVIDTLCFVLGEGGEGSFLVLLTSQRRVMRLNITTNTSIELGGLPPGSTYFPSLGRRQAFPFIESLCGL